MNFPFHEFKHLIDQNNNINSNNRSFNKTQRVKSIQEGPTEKFKTIKIVSITSRRQNRCLNNSTKQKKSIASKSEEKQKSKFKFSLLQGKNNQDCASTKKSILTPQNKPQPIKNVKGINQKNSIKYYKVKNNKIAFKNSSSTIKNTKICEPNNTFSESTSYITTTNKEDSVKNNTSKINKNLLLYKQLSSVKLRCKKLFENYSNLTKALLSQQ